MPAPAPLLSGINIDEGLKVLPYLISRLKPVSGLDFDEQKLRHAGLDRYVGPPGRRTAASIKASRRIPKGLILLQF